MRKINSACCLQSDVRWWSCMICCLYPACSRLTMANSMCLIFMRTCAQTKLQKWSKTGQIQLKAAVFFYQEEENFANNNIAEMVPKSEKNCKKKWAFYDKEYSELGSGFWECSMRQTCSCCTRIRYASSLRCPPERLKCVDIVEGTTTTFDNLGSHYLHLYVVVDFWYLWMERAFDRIIFALANSPRAYYDQLTYYV